MKITRLNYELYALDYVEGKLPTEELQAMVDFLQEHPDLQAELEAMGAYLPLKADPEVVYEHKERLLRHEAKIVVTRLFLYRAASVAAAVLLLLAGYLIGLQRGTELAPQAPIAQIVQINAEGRLVTQEQATPPATTPKTVVVAEKVIAPTTPEHPIEQTEQVVQIETPELENDTKNIPQRPATEPLSRLASVNLESLPLNSDPSIAPEDLEFDPSEIAVKRKPGRELVRFARKLIDKLPLEDIEFSPIPSYYANARQTSSK
jgi:hypothetical protein